jgi:hypothetical protein
MEPAEPPQIIRVFTPYDKPITQDGLVTDQNGWLIESNEERTIRLFEIENPNVEQCIITYRGQMKSENIEGKAYLEMWCRFPGRGEFFSKGFHNAIKGTTEWASYEIPFYLKKGQRPDMIKLNVVMEGSGKIWIKNIELMQTPSKK